MAADNKVLGEFNLVGIAPAPRGVPQVEVTFDIDANGIVNVSAKDKATGKEQQIRIQASGGLSDEDIETMISEAEQNAEADKKRRELVEVKNEAEQAVHSTERMLTDFGEKIEEADRQGVESCVAEVKSAIEGEDVGVIKGAVDALQQASMKLGEAMYQAQQEADNAGDPEGQPEGMHGAGPEGEKTAESEVVDADFEEVDSPNKDKTD